MDTTSWVMLALGLLVVTWFVVAQARAAHEERRRSSLTEVRGQSAAQEPHRPRHAAPRGRRQGSRREDS